MAKKFYITTTAPYVNAPPHIGFALEIIQADVIARYHQLLGDDVFFNTGTDEHGVKIYRKALEAKKNPQDYVDEYATKFGRLKTALNLSYNHSIRTTDPKHIVAAQEFWRKSLKNGDIYKKFYKIKYCSGCELEKTDSELENGKCPLHPNLNIDTIEEENYFFRFSKFQKPLLQFYEQNPQFVIPQYRFNEIISFVSHGLEDFSVSRLKSKMPWGIDVPDDPDHVMYVWFDALIFYISSIGWPEKKDFDGYWPGFQVAGKDNLRQQSAIWQAMLMSAGLPNTKQIYIHGFISISGQKISKSLGNVVDPYELVDKYGIDALRYYLLREIPAYDDGDFSERRFKELYNADLANGLGNLVARVAKLAEGLIFESNTKVTTLVTEIHTSSGIQQTLYKKYLDAYQFDEVLKLLWGDVKVIDEYLKEYLDSKIALQIRDVDQYINNKQPWTLKGQERKDVLRVAVDAIRYLATQLQPFLPTTAKKILEQFKGPTIKSQPPLFPRIQ
jgi:methionyl-tRNA synthetase